MTLRPLLKLLTKKLFFMFIGVTFMFFVYSEFIVVINFSPDDSSEADDFNDIYRVFSHETIVNRFLKRREELNTSNLGAILFKDEVYNKDMLENREPRTYNVLIWKFYDKLEKRHIYNFKREKRDPLENCSVRNCIFTGNSSMMSNADAVVVHLHWGDFPKDTERDPAQRWIFLSDEAPPNTFARAGRFPRLKEIDGVFNWSMTFRSESDIPVPYGRVVPLKKPKLEYPQFDLTSIIPYWEEKDSSVLAAALVSHCLEFRLNYIKKLKKYVTVDIHGKCSDSVDKISSCPGYFRADCTAINKYIFYLSFENTNCHEYITEKVWHNAYAKGAIPVIMAPSIEDCELLLPPSSYIHVNQFKNLEELANKMIKISKDEEMLMSYHKWRNNFEVLNEHGYFKTNSVHYCRICEALNYNNEEQKVYSEADLRRFLDGYTACRPFIVPN